MQSNKLMLLSRALNTLALSLRAPQLRMSIPAITADYATALRTDEAGSICQGIVCDILTPRLLS